MSTKSKRTHEVSFTVDEMLRLAERIRRLWFTCTNESYPGPGWFTFDSCLPQDIRDVGESPVNWILEGLVHADLWPNSVDVSVRYSSPDLLESQQVTLQSDIFGLGIHGYIMLAGRDPFIRKAASVVEAMTARIKGPYPDVREYRKACPRSLGNIIMKCLSPAPSSRYVSVEELIEELKTTKERLLSTIEKSE